MFNKLKSHFDLSKSSSRFLFTILLYFIYLFFFYFFVPLLMYILQFGGALLLVVIFFIAPVLSFNIPKALKDFSSNKKLYLWHTIFVVIFPFVYTYFMYYFITRHLNFGGF